MGDLPLFDPFQALAEIRAGAADPNETGTGPKLSQQPAREKDHAYQSDSQTIATLATLAGGSECVAPHVRPRKEEERKENSIISCTYASDRGSQPGPRENAREGSARVARVAREKLSDCETTITPESAPARVLEELLREWRAGLAGLSPERLPCPGYTLSGWTHALGRALVFLDRFGAQAEALGWTTPRLFGVHPEIGVVRVDHCGALVLPVGGPVRAITATDIALGHLTYRHKPYQPQGVPIWEFGR